MPFSILIVCSGVRPHIYGYTVGTISASIYLNSSPSGISSHSWMIIDQFHASAGVMTRVHILKLTWYKRTVKLFTTQIVLFFYNYTEAKQLHWFLFLSLWFILVNIRFTGSLSQKKNTPRNGYKTAPYIYNIISDKESKTYNNANNPIQITK